jgi:hypothetical protein
MIRIFAKAACVLSFVVAAPIPAFAQVAPVHVDATVPGEGTGDTGTVNRTIPGTPGSPGTVVNPTAPGQTPKPHIISPAPLLHDGLYSPGTPSIAATNRTNGTMGQEPVSGVTGIRGVRPVGSPPLNQHVGVDRP